MFRLKKKGPSRPTEAFAHAVGCKIVVADPDFQPEWQEISAGHWRRTCQCYSEDIYEPRLDTRTRLDPLDPATFRHFGGCEHRDTTDPTIVKAILRVRDRDGYCGLSAPPARAAGRCSTTPRRVSDGVR